MKGREWDMDRTEREMQHVQALTHICMYVYNYCERFGRRHNCVCVRVYILCACERERERESARATSFTTK